ncbi:hypothetical protein, variant [Puccinia graminis f. sp. tritici CRL 75-36-700-3]|uniref:Uncharacterized protein n=1 Tax=Puccinia graminis f. sp. tritici (strain CRL 75-36-700-3 / race SCCL) TaxID=418459 RepID=H6QS48_PUCGT|nr:hypothetical protein, variant [Puccinia graminis f. sp. tritici CRL 75-36-700-3]EHS63521.1 hypothetical protein, variant [Puccinia graminis f. sp. tritici CRL 75-36-700-3]
MLGLSHCLLAIYLAGGLTPAVDSRPSPSLSHSHGTFHPPVSDQAFAPDHTWANCDPLRGQTASTNPFDYDDDQPNNDQSALGGIQPYSLANAQHGFGAPSHTLHTQIASQRHEPDLSSGWNPFMDPHLVGPATQDGHTPANGRLSVEAPRLTFEPPSHASQQFNPFNDHPAIDDGLLQLLPNVHNSNPFVGDDSAQQISLYNPVAPGASTGTLTGSHPLHSGLGGASDTSAHLSGSLAGLKEDDLTSIMPVDEQALKDSVFGSSAYGSASNDQDEAFRNFSNARNQELHGSTQVSNSNGYPPLIEFDSIASEQEKNKKPLPDLAQYADGKFIMKMLSKFDQALKESVPGIKTNAQKDYAQTFEILLGATLILNAKLRSSKGEIKIEELKAHSEPIAEYVIQKFCSVLGSGFEDNGDVINKLLIELFTTEKDLRDYWTPVLELTRAYATKTLKSFHDRNEFMDALKNVNKSRFIT